MSKFTPGPWRIYEDKILGKAVKYFVVYSKMGEKEIVVADAGNKNDARLIAAAPELLEACQAALNLAKEFSEGDLYDQISDAIKQATGES